jgi:hypothetical protein
VGTGAFTGLVVPQYLTDMYAPMATGEAVRSRTRAHHHDLPPTGHDREHRPRITTGDEHVDNQSVGEHRRDRAGLSTTRS